MPQVKARVAKLFENPFLRRVNWHLRRLSDQMEAGFFRSLLIGLVVILLFISLIVWAFETDHTLAVFGASFYWAATTVLGQGDASFASGPVGWVMGWLLGLFGVAIVATITGALVGFMIDFLLKEGQGMGASGYRGHIVVCGWNATARNLIEELKEDEYGGRVVLVYDSEKSPAGDGVYFVRGSDTSEADLKRAGIEHARSAIVCPSDGTDEADMHSILVVLAIESVAPDVRTVVEVNNPKHTQHFRRAHVDEFLVTSVLSSHLLARSAMYPGLSELVTDIVSGGEGSELYRVELPDDCVDKPIDEVSAWLRRTHAATLLAVAREGVTHTNPAADFKLAAGDDLVVLAESLGKLRPYERAASPA